MGKFKEIDIENQEKGNSMNELKEIMNKIFNNNYSFKEKMNEGYHFICVDDDALEIKITTSNYFQQTDLKFHFMLNINIEYNGTQIITHTCHTDDDQNKCCEILGKLLMNRFDYKNNNDTINSDSFFRMISDGV